MSKHPSQLSIVQQIVNSSNGLTFFKSPDCEIQFAGKLLLQLSGYKSVNELVGKTDFDCAWDAFADQYHADDIRTMRDGESLELIEPLALDGRVHMLYTKKGPIYDGDKLLGIYGQSQILNSDFENCHNDVSFLLKNHPEICVTKQQLKKLHGGLSLRQSHVLYFLLRGFTAKEIALKLSLSFRTVQTHIEKLKIKFDCKNLRELIHIAVRQGYIYLLPENV